MGGNPFHKFIRKSKPRDTVEATGLPETQARRKAWQAFSILIIGLILTLFAILSSKSQLDAVGKQEFIADSNEIRQKIQDRFIAQEAILLSSAGFFTTMDTVTREDWHIFIRSLNVDYYFPGTQAFAFAELIPSAELPGHIAKIRAQGFPEYTVRPEGTRETYTSVIYIEPFTGTNMRAFGYDMFTEPVRRAAMERARDENKAALSGRVTLVTETEMERTQAGMLLYIPVYKRGVPIENVQQRRSALVGWVFNPYRMSDLIQSIVGDQGLQTGSQLHLQVFDGEDITPDTLLYDSLADEGLEHLNKKETSLEIPIDIAGRRMTLLFTRAQGLKPLSGYTRLWITGVAGTSISLLLFALFFLQSNIRFRAEQIARGLNAELSIANKELLFQNEEKEKRAAELVIANKELLFQNEEKGKRAAELVIANKELLFQNEEKEKRAAELITANKELLFQNEEKEKRAAELITANKELAFQNEEKEKRAAELITANKVTVRRLQNIQALYTIDRAIAGSLDLGLTLNVVLEQVKTQLNVDAAAILLINPHAQILEFAAGIGFRSKAIEHKHLRLGEGYGGRAALERRTVSVTHLLENDTHFIAPFLADEGFATYFGTPLIAKGQVNGVLEVFHRSPFAPEENWLEFFKVLAGQTAIAVDSANLFTELKRSNAQLFAAYDSTIEGWSHALDLRDKETEGHTQRVTEMTLKLARAAGITEEELVHVRRGALLHDIGKMGVPDHILLKPGKLTDEEWIAMRKHTTFAFELLSPITYLRPALDIPYCHHEKWDGSGYPRGLRGEQIPLVARLFAIIDIWDALLSVRPYRQGWPKEKVIEHIKSLSGTHLDPKAVELFLKVMNADEKNAG